MEASRCRVCLEHKKNMVNIFDRIQESGTCIANVLSQWSGYPVEKDDPYPKTICPCCLQDAEKEEKNLQLPKESLIGEEASSSAIIKTNTSSSQIIARLPKNTK